MDSGENSSVCTSRVAAIEDASPSVKLVFKTLEYEGGLTPSAIAETTYLSPRTVRKATRELECRGVVTSRVCLSDARKRVYSLVPPLLDSGSPRDQ